MSETAAQNAVPTTTDVSSDDFEQEFGLEPNAAPEALSTDAVEGLNQEVDDQMEDDSEDDNIILLERRNKRRERVADPTPPEGETNDSVEGEAEEVTAEAETEEGEEEAEGEDESAEEAAPELSDEQAQEYLDYLMDKFGDKLQLKYRANGEERTSTLKEIRDSVAPGYMGQDGVHRTFEQVTQLRQEAEQMQTEARETIEAAREDLLGYLKEPHRLIDDFVVARGGVDALRALRDQADTTLEQIDSDPATYRLERQVAGLTGLVQQLANGRQSAETAARPEAEAQEPEFPENFGFQPGQGYPKAMIPAAFHALKAAAKVAGVPPNEVLDAWEQDGRQSDVFSVLDAMVAQRARNAPKVERAKQPPIKAMPKGRVAAGGKTKTAQQAPRWSDIEGNLARALQQAG